MLDDNWELINGPVAHDIEVLNYANQVNVIEALVKLLMHHGGLGPSGCPMYPNLAAMSEIHRTGTLFLLAKPGEVREEDVSVINAASRQVVHQPPPFTELAAQLDRFMVELKTGWGTEYTVTPLGTG